MIADCHMHTSFSTDSKACPEEMIERAIALGMKEICITDHYDMDYPRNPRTGEEEFQLDTPAYQAKIRELQERYRDRIQIRFGVELGLQAHLKKQMEEYVRRWPFDFVIGSMHLLNGKDPYDCESFQDMEDREMYRSYFRATSENLRAFHEFQTLGHLDYVVRYGKSKGAEYRCGEYRDEIDEILKLLVEYQIALEVNTGGLKYGLGFPNPHPEIIRRYRELGGEMVTVGSDAHEPRHIGFDFEKAAELLKEAGFQYYTQFTERKPVFVKL